MRYHNPTWIIALILLFASSVTGMAADPNSATGPKSLSAEDKQFLADLLKEFLFDPQGAQRVRIPMTLRSAWGTSEEVEREGWLVPGKRGQPDRIYFTDGENIPARTSSTIS